MTSCCSPFICYSWMISFRGRSSAPWKAIPPHCCQLVWSPRTWPGERLRLIPQTLWLQAGGSNWSGTPVLPWLSYHSVLLLTPVLCHLRGPQITCCSVPLSSSTLTLALSVSVSLGPPDTHSCLLPQDIVLHVCNAERAAR